MGRIAILDEATIGQIAAGEVIERPVSVVKELLENSIDAGARRITISVEEGGCRAITVVDDGEGMERDDAVLALQRHATSKIRDARDLAAARTLGFRGEALASIAAISALEIITRARGAVSGVRLAARGGTIADLQEAGAPEGTGITVRHLFFNTPVRRRYLKSPATELGHIADCVAQYAVAHPSIGFRLSHSGETLLATAGQGNLFDAIVAILGADSGRQLIPIDQPGELCSLSGYIARPTLTRGTRSGQWFFVNARPIRSRVIAHAVEQAYHTLVPSGRHPIAVLLLTMDPALVDVNVHPSKSEVRFLSEGEVHRFVSHALREALGRLDLTPRLDAHSGGSLPSAGASPPPDHPDSGHDASEAPAPALPFPEGNACGRTPPQARAQIHDTYILAEGEDGLLIIDQHTAHERALFEQILSGTAGDLMRPLPLAVPFVLNLDTRQASALRDSLDALHAAGFSLHPFGRDAYLVRAVPAALADTDCESLLRDAIEEILSGSAPRSIEARREQIASFLACRGAVKSGDRLTLQEMQAIIRGLYALPSRFTCQHGRPTAILLSREELARRFNR